MLPGMSKKNCASHSTGPRADVVISHVNALTTAIVSRMMNTNQPRVIFTQ